MFDAFARHFHDHEARWRARWTDPEGWDMWFGPGGGPFGPGGPFGRGGPFARGARNFGRGAERFLERGDLKYAILDLLREQPRHGYDVIRALEERFGGFYRPSPGVVYPTLQLLEDQGAIVGEQRDGKRVYTLTDEGRRMLEERGDPFEGIHERVRSWFHGRPGEIGDLLRELQGIGWTLFRPETRGWWTDPATVQRIRAVVARAREEIEAILREDRPGTRPPAPEREPEPPIV